MAENRVVNEEEENGNGGGRRNLQLTKQTKNPKSIVSNGTVLFCCGADRM